MCAAQPLRLAHMPLREHNNTEYFDNFQHSTPCVKNAQISQSLQVSPLAFLLNPVTTWCAIRLRSHPNWNPSASHLCSHALFTTRKRNLLFDGSDGTSPLARCNLTMTFSRQHCPAFYKKEKLCTRQAMRINMFYDTYSAT
eukprot:726418-Amphidinium_carterae.1